MYTTLLLIVLGIPLILLAAVLAAPRPIFAWADRRLYKALDVTRYNQESPYGARGFQPVHSEMTHTELKVSGTIPEELDGVYLRNGTNTQFQETKSRLHMFNGAGMLHQVQISNGRAMYANTYIRTPRFEIEEKAGEELYLEFGNIVGGGKASLFSILIDALKKRFGVIPKLATLESVSSTTAIQWHKGKLYCLQETGYPFALNTRLERGKLVLDGTGELETFGGQLKSPFSAHPKIDPETGDFYAFTTDFKSGRIHYSLLREGKLVKYNQVVQAKPALAFLHDYYVTESRAVFPDMSLRFSPKEFTGPYQSPMYFDPDYKLRFGVIKKDHSKGDSVQWFTTDRPGFIWHTINGWEETRDDGGTDIVVYAPVFRDYPPNIPIHSPQEPHAHLTVWRLNLDTGEVTEERELVEHFYERPSINPDYVGKKNRYAYLLDEEKEGVMGKGVLKYDLENEEEVKYFDYGEHYGGEALFVAKANATKEDEGYLLDLLMKDEEAALVIIDAETMEEVARLHIPQRVPFGVHGCWLDKEKIDALA